MYQVNSPPGAMQGCIAFYVGAGTPLRIKPDKFAWSKFEQPIGWPEGRKPRMVFVLAQG